jgi:hypothetical protein
MDVCVQGRVLSEPDDHSEIEWHRSDTAEWRLSPQPSLRSWYKKRFLSLTLVSQTSEETLLETFESLRTSWHRERGVTSSLTRIVNTPSYLKIIRQGKRFLPLIIQDLQERRDPDHWFEALRQITHSDPVDPKVYGNYRKMAKAWVKWYQSQPHDHAAR